MFIFIVLVTAIILFIIIIELDKKEKNSFVDYKKRRADNKLKWNEIEKTRKLTTSEMFQKIIDSSEGEPHYTTFSSGLPESSILDIDKILKELEEKLQLEKSNHINKKKIKELYKNISTMDLSNIDTQSTVPLRRTLEKSAKIHKRINALKKKRKEEIKNNKKEKK